MVPIVLVWASWAATVGRVEVLGLWCWRGLVILVSLEPRSLDGGGVAVEAGSVGPHTLFTFKVEGFLLLFRFSCRSSRFCLRLAILSVKHLCGFHHLYVV